MNSFILVGIGGGLGAMSRFGVGLLLGRAMSGTFPYATLVVNVVGSLFMGLLMGYLLRYTPQWSDEARLFVGVGLLGGFTTFSAFSLDAISLIERGEILSFLAYVFISIVAALGALAVGLLIMRGTL